jgi:hypothetical protein
MLGFRSLPAHLAAAGAALALAAVFFGVMLLRAMSPAEVEASQPVGTPVVALSDHAPARVAEIIPAVEKDPFNPERQRPARRYRLAGEIDEAAPPTARLPIRWGGAVIGMGADSTDSRFFAALGTNNNAPLQSLKPGDKLGDYTLKSFDALVAIFVSPNGDLISITNPRKEIR